MIIGKGNDPVQNRLFGYDLADQWQLNQVGIEALDLPADEQRANLSLFLETVAPVLRSELPSPVWPGTAVPA